MSDSDNHHAAVQQERDTGLREHTRSLMHGAVPEQVANIAVALNDMRERMGMLENTIESNYHELITQNRIILSLVGQVIALIQEGNHQGLGKLSTPSICHSLSGAQ